MLAIIIVVVIVCVLFFPPKMPFVGLKKFSFVTFG